MAVATSETGAAGGFGSIKNLVKKAINPYNPLSTPSAEIPVSFRGMPRNKTPAADVSQGGSPAAGASFGNISSGQPVVAGSAGAAFAATAAAAAAAAAADRELLHLRQANLELSLKLESEKARADEAVARCTLLEAEVTKLQHELEVAMTAAAEQYQRRLLTEHEQWERDEAARVKERVAEVCRGGGLYLRRQK